MTLNGIEQPRLFDPMTEPSMCEHRERRHTDFCTLHNCYTSCGESHFGEPPMCSFEEPDNSEEACRKRLEWIGANG